MTLLTATPEQGTTETSTTEETVTAVQDSVSGKFTTDEETTATETTDTATTEPVTADWRSGLSADIREEACLANFTEVDTLAKSYINAQKLIGKDKVVIPNDQSSEEDWDDFYKKVGIPDEEDYKLEGFSEEGEETSEFEIQYTQLARELNLFPHQAEGVAEFFNDLLDASETDTTNDYQQVIDEGMVDLKNDWGNKFDSNILAAQAAFQVFGDDAAKEYMNTTGMSNDPVLLKIFANIGANLTESTFKGGFSSFKGNTPNEAQQKIDSIMDDFKHPYHNAEHSNHGNSVKEMEKLFDDLTQG